MKDHVVKGGRRTLCISIRGSQVVFSGEENYVVVAQENKKVNSSLELKFDNVETFPRAN